MSDPTWISLLPPVLAIVLAIWSKQVYLSLAEGLWLAWTVVSGWNPLSGLAAAVQGAVDVLGSDGNARAIMFTFAIMLPIAVPAAAGLGLPIALFLAAALSGGIFGDHCPPISDTANISSMTSATDHIDHVRTQLPYALVGGGIATICFGLLGATL